MTERSVARRYAAALLQATDAAGLTEPVESLLLSLKESLRSDRSLRDFLASPRIPRRAKSAVLRRALGSRAPELFLRFLDTLAQRDRLPLLPWIADLFDELADQSAGIVRVEVRSFLPLTDPQERELRSRLERLLGGRRLRLDKTVDPGLAGGLWVRVGDSLLDGSVATRLKRLRERLLA